MGEGPSSSTASRTDRANPEEARRSGVAMVYQELSLCPHLTVAENVLSAPSPRASASFAGKSLSGSPRRCSRPSRRRFDPRALVGDLSPAAQQLVEIARALAHRVPTADRSGAPRGVLILDEPTSCLAAGDVARLFEVLRGLRERGTTIVYVSHFLDEVKAISDAYTVLRDGRTVAAGNTADARIPAMVQAMVGRAVDTFFPRSARTPGEVVIETVELRGIRKPIRASLALRRGEVLGIAGLVGAGRTELLRAILASTAWFAAPSGCVGTRARRLPRDASGRELAS